MKSYLIIGAGAAGMEAAQTIRKQDADSAVTIVSAERYTHYFRPKLIHFLAGDEAPGALEVHDAAWYGSNGIELVTGRRILSIDAAARIAVDDHGRSYGWDRLLLACGGNSFVPPVAGAGRPGVFVLRSLDDAIKIREYSASRKRAVVIGGGLLGLEGAFSLSVRGMDVTVVEFAPWLLPRQLDRQGGGRLRSLLEAKGLHFALDAQVEALEGSGEGGAVERIRLKSGSLLEADMVIISVGVRSETSLALASGLTVNRGIVVGDRLETSVPGVYAAGDAAEHRGVCYGLWTIAHEQGRVAGLNMAGIDTPYEGSTPSSQLKITGIDLYSAGDIASAEAKDDGSSLIVLDEAERYRKMRVGADGKPLFAMVINDRAAIAVARKVMSGAAKPDEFRLL